MIEISLGTSLFIPESIFSKDRAIISSNAIIALGELYEEKAFEDIKYLYQQ